MHHLAQINVGRLLAPIDSPLIRDFVDNLDRINALAESQPGFIWRLTGEGNNATDIQAFDDPMIQLNMSVWDSVETLGGFVYRTAHRDIMRRRREWFEAMEVYMALWWIPAGHTPSPAEGRSRLETLIADGPSPAAFTFRTPFPRPGLTETQPPVLDRCA